MFLVVGVFIIYVSRLDGNQSVCNVTRRCHHNLHFYSFYSNQAIINIVIPNMKIDEKINSQHYTDLHKTFPNSR